MLPPDILHTEGIIRDLSQGRSPCFAGLTPPAAAFLASRLAAHTPLLLVCPDTATAATFCSDLRLFQGRRDVMLLPPPEDRPYEGLLPDPETSASRIQALYGLMEQRGLVVAPAAALMYPVPPSGHLERWRYTVRTGRFHDREEMVRRFDVMGYRRTPVVMESGTFAVRGGILDVFSPGMRDPCRIELWDDEVRSLRSFDSETQRSLEPLESATLYPMAEMPLEGPERDRVRSRIQDLLLASATPSADREEMLGLWDERLPVPGEPLYLPLMDAAVYPLELLPDTVPVLLFEPEECFRAIRDRTREAMDRADGRFPDPADLFCPIREIEERIAAARHLVAGEADRESCTRIACSAPFPDTGPAGRADRLAGLARWLTDAKESVVLTTRSETAARRLLTLLGPAADAVRPVAGFEDALASDGPALVTGSLSEGFRLAEHGLTVVSDSDLFGRVRSRPWRRAAMPEWDLPIGSLEEGDIVVHVDHGIGRYLGLRQLDIAGATDDFLHIAFARDDSLYVPVWELNRVQRYRSSSDTPPALSRLGSAAWKRTKTRIRRSLRMMADDLLKVSAVRQRSRGHAFAPPDSLFRAFEASFPWQETPDQERSVRDVIADMTSPHPMDRLVCGDVGFGKTEVAMRAAFLATADGKQTAVLVPTTVLAQQHYQTFVERLADFPVTVALLSRFVTPAEQERTLSRLAAGEIDIIIGTHRLLSDDVQFGDIGLLVIDEEHRFGVRHKEKLKKLRKTVDVLTLSATPIPRTLFQAFSGLRSLSLIHTPPADRKSIHTEVRYFDEGLIRDAILREMDRGGQVFAVHNRVQTIDAFAGMLADLCPEARIAVAHGQMVEKDLEGVMIRFLAGEHDVLVSTAIIESGLDITNANTLIINHAERFGLAQLYQLRGRVGRSSSLGYAYLLIPSESGISRQARRRLQRLRELTELGSGFKLATFDLEMRGAGNLLGAEQSGRIDAVGIDLYSQLLEQAVRDVAGERESVRVEPSITLPIPTFLPEDYLPDVGERLTLYKRIAGAQDEKTLTALRDEITDRFGRLPPEASGLFTRISVTLLARDLGVERVDTAGPYILVGFHPEARIAPDVLVGLLTTDNRLNFLPPTTLRIDTSSLSSPGDRVSYLVETLRAL